MALICPECSVLVATRDGKHYGTHFPSVLSQKPCAMSCKPIVVSVMTIEVDHTESAKEFAESWNKKVEAVLLEEFLRSG